MESEIPYYDEDEDEAFLGPYYEDELDEHDEAHGDGYGPETTATYEGEATLLTPLGPTPPGGTVSGHTHCCVHCPSKTNTTYSCAPFAEQQLGIQYQNLTITSLIRTI